MKNHVKDLVAIDFFTVPTATFGVLFGFLVLAHDRRRVLHFNVTANPSAEWTARQVLQAFPDDTTQQYLVRNRDQIYGGQFRHMLVQGAALDRVVELPAVGGLHHRYERAAA